MHSWCVVDTPKDDINTISALVFHELFAVLTVRAQTGTTCIMPFSSQVCPFNTSKVQLGVVSHSSTCAALHMGGYKALTMQLRVSGQNHETLAVRANSINLGFRADPSLMAGLMEFAGQGGAKYSTTAGTAADCVIWWKGPESNWQLPADCGVETVAKHEVHLGEESGF